MVAPSRDDLPRDGSDSSFSLYGGQGLIRRLSQVDSNEKDREGLGARGDVGLGSQVGHLHLNV